MNRFMLIREEIENESKIFKYLRHILYFLANIRTFFDTSKLFKGKIEKLLLAIRETWGHGRWGVCPK
jgi:hypothetical protein